MDIKNKSSSSSRPNSVETLGPVSSPKKSRSTLKTLSKTLIILVVIAGIGGSTYLLKQEKDKTVSYSNEVESLNGQVSNLKDQTAVSGNTQTVEAAEKKDSLKLPVVVFTPDGVFTAKDKESLNKMVINPMIDYTPDVFVSVDVEIYSQDKFVGGTSDNKYIITTVGKPGEGGTGGFVFGSKTKPLDYWTPTCLDKCEFTDEFKAKYPEVVQKYESSN